MSFYVYETQAEIKPSRTCDECNAPMIVGYLDDISGDTYCSSDCLDKAIPGPEQAELLINGILFWTTWYDEVGVAE